MELNKHVQGAKCGAVPQRGHSMTPSHGQGWGAGCVTSSGEARTQFHNKQQKEKGVYHHIRFFDFCRPPTYHQQNEKTADK